MADWRVGRGWTEAELEPRLAHLDRLDLNFEGSHAERRTDPAWKVYGSHSVLATFGDDLSLGDEFFERGREALARYSFSDPTIVEAHFRSEAPLLGRRMLLELKVPVLRYLCGVAVGEVRDTEGGGTRTFGFRYDTLDGHLECGSEWFVLERDRLEGVLCLRIEAVWQRGDFPNWWSRLGFALVGEWYQRRWHRKVHERMAALVRGEVLVASGRGSRLAHEGPRVVFTDGVQARGHLEMTR